VRAASEISFHLSTSAPGEGQPFDVVAKVTPVPASGTVSILGQGGQVLACEDMPVDPTTGRVRCRGRAFDIFGTDLFAFFWGNDDLAASEAFRPFTLVPVRIRIERERPLARPGDVTVVTFKVVAGSESLSARAQRSIVERCQVEATAFGKVRCPTTAPRGRFSVAVRVPDDATTDEYPIGFTYTIAGRVVDSIIGSIKVRTKP
jgi:hypothetical protein